MKILSKNKTTFGVFMAMIAILYSSCEFEGASVPVVDEPSIIEYSPKSGVPNTLVSITGTDFGTYRPAVKVYFGGIEADVDSVNNELVQVRVPSAGIMGEGEVTIKYYLYDLAFPDSFTVLEGAKITGLSPDSGKSGDVITITGERFGTDLSQVSVQFAGALNSVDAEVLSVTDTEINVIVPEESITGSLSVTVNPEVLETSTFFNEGVTIFPLVQAEAFDNMFGIQLETTQDIDHPFWFEGDENVGWTDDGDWMSYEGQFLDDAVSVDIRVAYNVGADATSEMEVRLGSETGTLIASIPITGTGGWQNWETFSIDLDGEYTGSQSVYVVVPARTNINWFQFSSIKIADR